MDKNRLKELYDAEAKLNALMEKLIEQYERETGDKAKHITYDANHDEWELYEPNFVKWLVGKIPQDCDHKVRSQNGMVTTFRNTCEICGTNMRQSNET